MKPKEVQVDDEEDPYPDLRMDFELPDLVEFEAFEDLLDLATDKSIRERKVIQRAVCLTATGEQEVDFTRLLFLCKVCGKRFFTLKACEKHLVNRGHLFPLVELQRPSEMNTEKSDNIWLQYPVQAKEQNHSFHPDFLPIHVGKWSKVICELRHRFGQVTESVPRRRVNGFISCPIDLGQQPDLTHTEPKELASSPNGDIANAIEKIDKCFRSKSNERLQTKSWPLGSGHQFRIQQRGTESGQLSMAEVENKPAEISCQNAEPKQNGGLFLSAEISTTNSPDEVGQVEASDKNVVEAGHDENAKAAFVPSEIVNGNPLKNEHRIYIDFESKSFKCEVCNRTFRNFEDAITHRYNWQGLDDSNSTDLLPCTEEAISRKLHEEARNQGNSRANGGGTAVTELIALDEPDSQTKQQAINVEIAAESKDVTTDDSILENENEGGNTATLRCSEKAEKQVVVVPYESEKTQTAETDAFGGAKFQLSSGDAKYVALNEKKSDEEVKKIPLAVDSPTESQKIKKKKKNKALRFVTRTFMAALNFLF